MNMSQMPMEKPGLFTGVAITTLISGIINILYGLSLTAGIVLGTLGIGLLCAPITILPSVLGIFELIYAIKLLGNPPTGAKPSQAIAIMEICCILLGNVLTTGAGIFALVAYSDSNVKRYFASVA
jgi:hypothetical protein